MVDFGDACFWFGKWTLFIHLLRNGAMFKPTHIKLKTIYLKLFAKMFTHFL